MSAIAIKNEKQEATMNAVIIYDDFDLAAQANAALESATQQLEAAAHWNVMPWRLEVLEDPSAAHAALKEATEAHLILLALRPGTRLPLWYKEWLETWATLRQVPDAALAFFGGGENSALSSELTEFARRHELTLIFDDGEVQDGPAFFTRSLQDREIAVTPTLQGILDQPLHNYYPRWGINE